MGKKHKHKKDCGCNDYLNLQMQIIGWVLIITLSFLIGYRTLQMFNAKNLARINENPSITNNITMFDYYVHGV